MMELTLVRAALAVLGTTIAAYTDWKTGYIYDKLTYPLIAAGVLLNLLEFDVWKFAPAAVVLAFGYALYYAGKIGGGDVKLFAGLGLLVPYTPNGLPFVLPVLLFSALAALTWTSAYYLAAYARKGIDWRGNRAGLVRGVVFALVTLGYFGVLQWEGRLGWTQALLLGLPLTLGIGYAALERGIRKEFFLAHVKIWELEEDEVLAAEFLPQGLAEKLGTGFKGVIEEKDKTRLKEMGLETVPVYRNLPRFGPFILVGVVMVLYAPQAFEWLTGLGP